MSESDEKLRQLIREFEVAMLVTRTYEGRLRARPMVIADFESAGVLWVLTDRHSGKMDEIAQEHHVNVTMQSSTRFISLSGKATHVDSPEKLTEVWKDSWKVWFPGGKDDPNLALVRIEGDAGEYWDQSGLQSVKYLWEAGKAYLSGTRFKVDADSNAHGKVEL
jgi:general stress protein 26